MRPPSLALPFLLQALLLAACMHSETSPTADPEAGNRGDSTSPMLAKVAVSPCASNSSLPCLDTPCPVSCPAAPPPNAIYFGDQAFEVAATASNDLFAVDYRRPVEGGFALKKYANDGSSQVIPAGVTALDMVGDDLWAVSDKGWIFRHAPPVTGLAWEHIGFTFNGATGFLARDVAGVPGSVFAISTEPVAGGFKLYKYSGSGDAWNLINAGLVQIDVDNDGTLWGVNSNGWIFRHRAPVTGNAWEHIGIIVNGRSGTLVHGISVGNGLVLALGTQSVPGGYKVFRYSGSADVWSVATEGVATLSVNANGKAWGANTDEKIYRSGP